MQQLLDTMSNKEVLKIITQIEDAHKGLPHLPKGLTEFFVSIAPYLAVIGGVLSVLGGVQMLVGMNSMYSMLEGFGVSNTYRYVLGLEQVVLGALYIWAFNYLKNRSFTGWLMMFWGMVISTIVSLISLVLFNAAGLVGTILGILIGLYILFELKPFYSKSKHVTDKVAADTKDV